MNFSQGTPFFKSHKMSTNHFGKKNLNSKMDSRKNKLSNTRFKKDLFLKKNKSQKSEFLNKKRLKGFGKNPFGKNQSRNGSMQKDGKSLFGSKFGKKTKKKLNDEYGHNEFGIHKKSNLEKFLQRNSRDGQIKNFKSESMRSNPKGFKPGLKQKRKGESYKVQAKIKNTSTFSKKKKNFKTLHIETSFEEKKKKNNESLDKNNEMTNGDIISFANNTNIPDNNIFHNDLNIYSRAKK